MSSPRLVAAQMLESILEKRLFLSEVRSFSDSLEKQDTSFVNMLVLTALRHLPRLKKNLKTYIKKRLPAKSRLAEYLILAAATELLYLKTPDYAVINSYVDTIKKQFDRYIAGMANAVLRKIAAESNSPDNQSEDCFFPQEFFKILRHSYSAKTIRKIEQAARGEPCLDITVTKKYENSSLKLGGIKLPNGSIRLKNISDVKQLPDYDKGQWWVQDFAASLAVKSLPENLSGMKILDLCAAPGGKTAQLAAAGASVTALDISDKRLKTLKENLNRLNLTAQIICRDAIEYLQTFNEKPFDIILLDAPCSATGTLRRHPEVVHLKKQEDISKQAAIQKQLLSLAPNALSSNGLLIFCTCSLCKEEGEEQIAEFLKTSAEFQIVPLQNIHRDMPEEIFTPEGFIRTLPFHLNTLGGTDGFFIALMQRIKNVL